MYSQNRIYSDFLGIWYNADPLNKLEGMRWYRNAHFWADCLSTFSGVDFARTCAILSALSPNCAWDVNKRDAEALILTNGEYENCTTYSSGVDKARKLLAGGDIYSLMCRRSALKTWHFFNNIYNPLSREFVTIDRHIARLAGLKTDKIPASAYLDLVVILQDCSRMVRVLPHQFQATIWLEVRPEEYALQPRFSIMGEAA